MDINKIFKKFYPKILEFTSTKMNNNKIKFLDILLIKIKNSIQYIMQIKPLKIEFYVPYTSNHPEYMKINIIKNMVLRAVILCSNYVLFKHTTLALRKRFKKSGYPNTMLNKYIDYNIYSERLNIIYKLKQNRIMKETKILKLNKIYYRPLWIPEEEKSIIKMPYDKLINDTSKCIKNIYKKQNPNKRIVHKLNDSIQKVIRCKGANYKL